MNLILITVDCLRADHLGCLGYPKKTTPNLDYLASTGILFSQAISVGSWTPTSFIAILTSTYPLMYGGQLRITDSRTTAAQVLKEHGYHTAAFHSNPWLSSYFGYQQGFDTFDDSIQVRYRLLMTKVEDWVRHIIGTSSRLYKFIALVYNLMRGNSYASGETLNRKAIAWLHDNSNNFFLWLHYMDTHGPYLPPSRFTSPIKTQHIVKSVRKAANSPNSLSPTEVTDLTDFYDAKISYVDKIIGSFLHTLKQNDILDNTFLIVTADHGEEFGQHGHFPHGSHLYDELIHVPLIIHGPGLEGQLIDQQVSLLDSTPTILDLLGIDKPDIFVGKSLLPLIMGETDINDVTAISEEGRTEQSFTDKEPKFDRSGRKMSLRTCKWKYIYNEHGQDELYHLEDDPKETQNIIDAQPDIATELRAKIMAHIEFEDRSTPGERELIKEKIRKLKASGKI